MGFRKFLLRSPPIRELFIAYRAAGVSYVMHPQRFYPSPAGLERNLDYRGFESLRSDGPGASLAGLAWATFWPSIRVWISAGR